MVMFWKALPATAAAAAGVKLVAAAWIAVRLYDRGVLSNRTLVLGAASWAGIVFALYGAASWIFPPLIIRSDHIALAAILIVPLARLSAAPLALAWNRHR
jgi:hypothetical protein